MQSTTLRRSSLVMLFAGLHAPLLADTIHLKSGFAIDGKVSDARSNQEQLVIELNSTGNLVIPRSQVLSVEKNARTGIPPERPAEEGRPTPLITPNMVKVKLKKGRVYYGQGELYGVKSPQSNDRQLVLSIPGAGEIRLPQEAVDQMEPASPPGGGRLAPAAAGAQTIRTTHRVKLANGGVISGTLVPSRPEEPLVLDLGSLGRVYLPRERIVEISPVPGEVKLPAPEEETPAPPAPPAVEEARPPVEVPARMMMDPELKQEILDNVYELTRQRTRNRVNAERRLVALGPVVIPFLAPAARDPFELTRRAVARIVRDIGHEAGVPIAIDLLTDEDRDVREIAHEALLGIAHQDLGYRPFASHRDRYRAQIRWREWWAEQHSDESRAEAPRAEEQAQESARALTERKEES